VLKLHSKLLLKKRKKEKEKEKKRKKKEKKRAWKMPNERRKCLFYY